MSNPFGYITGTLLLVFFFCLSQSARPQASEHPTQKTVVTESFALDKVLLLSEVRHTDADIRRKSNGKGHLASLLSAKPNHIHPYYWVAIGEDNGGSFVTYFNFYVYNHERKILYLDTDTGKAIDLAAWRRRLIKK